jgi:hypothetical protein
MLNAMKSSTALFLTLGVSAVALSPLMMAAPAQAQITFTDVASDNWAAPFIQELSTRGVIKGFKDGSFRPEERVTRAQYASMLTAAFSVSSVRDGVSFRDVPTSYWAYSAIQSSYTKGFMSGYNSGEFRPAENIPRAQALVSLANGLRLAAPASADSVLSIFSDADSIPAYARNGIAAAATQQIVVNYPNVAQLEPNKTMTRAEAAAFIYQALNNQGQVAAVTSPYIVGSRPQVAREVRIPSGTVLPVRYDKASKILLGKNEPSPTPIALTISQNIVDAKGKVLIPAGSQVEGNLKVDQGAAQFLASTLVLTNGQRIALDALSEKITTVETVKKGASAGTLIKDTALGAAAAAGIARVTGDRQIKAWEVLTGATTGAIAGLVFGKDKVELISIKPNTDLALQLNSALVLPQ